MTARFRRTVSFQMTPEEIQNAMEAVASYDEEDAGETGVAPKPLLRLYLIRALAYIAQLEASTGPDAQRRLDQHAALLRSRSDELYAALGLEQAAKWEGMIAEVVEIESDLRAMHVERKGWLPKLHQQHDELCDALGVELPWEAAIGAVKLAVQEASRERSTSPAQEECGVATEPMAPLLERLADAVDGEIDYGEHVIDGAVALIERLKDERARSEQRRVELAEKLGLCANSPWERIAEAVGSLGAV